MMHHTLTTMLDTLAYVLANESSISILTARYELGKQPLGSSRYWTLARETTTTFHVDNLISLAVKVTKLSQALHSSSISTPLPLHVVFHV